MNSKQRAFLRGKANTLESILQVGKGGVGDNTIQQAEQALTARELIKGNVLETSESSVREVAEEIAAATHSEVVQVIGRRFVLFRENPELKQYPLPR